MYLPECCTGKREWVGQCVRATREKKGERATHEAKARVVETLDSEEEGEQPAHLDEEVEDTVLRG